MPNRDHVQSIQMGVIYWPPYTREDKLIKKGIGITIDNSDILTAQIPWHPDVKDFMSQVSWIGSLARTHNRSLIVNIDWMRDDRKGLRGDNWIFKNSKTKQSFVKSVLELCRAFNPDYINLGVEVNFYALKNPDDFREFVNLYNHTRQLLKASFPQIKVSVSFQLEMLFGQHRNWQKKSSFEILEAFGDNFDILAISTYPHSNVKAFSNFETLSEILTMTKKPIGIFETSIPTNVYGEEDQVKYLNSLIDFLKVTQRCEVIVWTSTADTGGSNNWIHHLGLLKSDLTPKKAFNSWRHQYHLNKAQRDTLGKLQSGPDSSGKASGR